MRLGLCDVVQHLLRGARLAGLLGAASAVEGDGLGLQREADLRAKLAEGALRLAVGGQRELPLLAHLLQPADGVLVGTLADLRHIYTCNYNLMPNKVVVICGAKSIKLCSQLANMQKKIVQSVSSVVCTIDILEKIKKDTAMIVSVLLVLLWSLVEVHSQAAPYLTFMGENLPDHSYVDFSALGEIDNENDHVVCHTDLTSCCGATGNDDRGYWFFPNGAELQGAAGGSGATTNPIVLMRTALLVRLIRGTGPGDVPSGLYRCIIETNADNSPNSDPSPGNGIGETLYVGVYSTGGMYSIHN